MNPQEKAKELIEKFWNKIKNETTASLSINRKKKAPLYNTAKQCALICVEEIISSYEKTKEADRSLIPVYNYWQSVLEAIKQIK